MKRLSLLLFGGALLAPVAVLAQEPPGGPPADAPRRHAMGHPPHGMGPGQATYAPRMLLNRRERLDLTDDQVKQLEALATEVRQAHEKAATDAKPHEEKLEELWKADQPDVNAIQAEMRALMQVRQTAASAAVTATARAKGLLTDEQRGRVEGWADGRRMGMERRMEMHGRAHGMRRGFRALPRMHRF